ncbi:hypothetical protein N0V95_005940 [Ascochyta clinopodiicola]|nr:hypothetical protein N0V95_005940 [Ascochyta clinopodiicola]
MTTTYRPPDPGAFAPLQNSYENMSPSGLTAGRSTLFRFMDLPAELRLEIYKEIVVVGKVFYTPDRCSLSDFARFDDYQNYHKPWLSILRVSKAVHNEAEDVYLSQNLFVLPFDFARLLPFIHLEPHGQRFLFSAEAPAKTRHLSIEVSSRTRDEPHTMERGIWDQMDQEGPETFDGRNEQERLQHAHDFSLWRYDAAEVYNINRLQDMHALQTLELDYTNAYCPVGCCRLTKMLRHWDEVLPKMKKVRVLGLRHEDEEKEFMTSWSTITKTSTEELYMKHDIQFDL